jgi:hypothetical protein
MRIQRLVATSIHPVRAVRRSLPTFCRAIAFLTLLAFVPDTTQSAPPPAGTSIGNQASATYTDSSNTQRTATSNVAITIVQQVASFTLTTDGQSRFAAPGGQVSFPHTLRNTGNGLDTFNLVVANNTGDNFDLNSLTLAADANGDGLPDNATPVTTTVRCRGRRVPICCRWHRARREYSGTAVDPSCRRQRHRHGNAGSRTNQPGHGHRHLGCRRQRQ